MTQSASKKTMWQQMRQEWLAAANWLDDSWRQTGIWLRNQLRELQGAKIDFVVIPVEGALPERAAPPRPFWQRQLGLYHDPLSLQDLNHIVQRICDADNVTGVLFIFQGLSTGFASLQNFRQTMQRLKDAGKKVVVYTPYLDLPHYYAATAADLIVAPPSAGFEVLGLHSSTTFLKDSLALAGIQFDVIQISPFKSAYDSFGKAEMSPELQQQISWLLDEQFDLLTTGMATGRGQTPAQLQAVIDQAPLFGEALCQHGLVDALVYEDELAYWLAEKVGDSEPSTEGNEQLPMRDEAQADEEEVKPEEENGDDSRPQANLVLWSEALPLLKERFRRSTKQYIGVVSLTGAIIPGESRNPPVDLPIPLVGGDMAGEATLTRLLRRAEEQDDMAALIFHVDSPGGSALASDLIARQIERIARKKPVVAYMGNVAASGGYYVSAVAHHIMAQPGTMTGSIGVINGRISLSELENKLKINRVTLKRGEHAELYNNVAPMNETERSLFHHSIQAIYQQFKEIVARGRELPYDELDPICEGRVWTGRQALAHKLVDSHGDFPEAIRQAAQLAGLPHDDNHRIQVVNFYDRDREYRLPQPITATADLLKLFTWESWQPFNGKPLLLMPFTCKFW